MVHKFPTGNEGVEVCIARPGVIANSTAWSKGLVANLFRIINRFGRTLPSIQRSELAGALLKQAMDGFEKRTLLNADLVRLGRRELKTRRIPRLSWIIPGEDQWIPPSLYAVHLDCWSPWIVISLQQGSEWAFETQQTYPSTGRLNLLLIECDLCLCLFVTWSITIPYYKGGVGGNPHGQSFFIMVGLVLKSTTDFEVRRL